MLLSLSLQDLLLRGATFIKSRDEWINLVSRVLE